MIENVLKCQHCYAAIVPTSDPAVWTAVDDSGRAEGIVCQWPDFKVRHIPMPIVSVKE